MQTMHTLAFIEQLFRDTNMIRQFSLSSIPFVLLTIGFATNANAQLQMWLSSSVEPAADAAVAKRMTTVLGSTSEIYLWAKPEEGKTLQNFSLNVVASNEDNVGFDSIEVENGTGDEPRFEFLFDSSNGLNIDDQVSCLLDDTSIFDLEDDTTVAVWGFRGFTLSSDDAIGVSSDDGSGVHLATIAVTGIEIGEVDLFLQVGEVGINHAGGTSEGLEVQFGPADGLLDAELERCQSSSLADITIEVVEGLLGDFNENGVLDADDIDLLSQQVRSGAAMASFELTGDANVDEADRTFWVETLSKTNFGDADLNGTVDFTDFLQLGDNYAGPGGWADGDFDGDQIVDFPDFLLLSASFGFSEASEVSTVPEPEWSPVILLSAILFLVGRCRRHRNGEAFASNTLNL